jgi:hypothetical protein
MASRLRYGMTGCRSDGYTEVLTDENFCLEATKEGQLNRFRSWADCEANLPSSPGEKVGRVCVGFTVRIDEEEETPEEHDVDATLQVSDKVDVKVDECKGTIKLCFSFLVPKVTGLGELCHRPA